MKKLIFIAISSLLIISCQKEQINTESKYGSEFQTLKEQIPKIDILHQEKNNEFISISVTPEELSQHIDHGDVFSDLHDRVSVCHRKWTGEFVIIEAPRKLAALLVFFGDAVDMDGDGFFHIDNSCSETDCDDNNPNVNPGVEDIPADEVDNNCDGDVDEGCLVCRQTGGPDDCIISDLELLELSCIDDTSYRICFEAITQNVPRTPADLRITIGELYTLGELSGLGLTARGFFGCVDLTITGQTDRDVHISVDSAGVCCFCKSNFWDDPVCPPVPNPTTLSNLIDVEIPDEYAAWRNN